MTECFLIRGSKKPDDGRYFVQVTVSSTYCELHIQFDFLIDTGCVRTLVSGKTVSDYGIPIQNLPQDRGVFEGVGGGKVIGRLLPESTLIFESNNRILKLPVGDLSVSEFQTGYGMYDPGSSSILALDVLHKFDLLFEDDSSAMILKYKAKC